MTLRLKLPSELPSASRWPKDTTNRFGRFGSTGACTNATARALRGAYMRTSACVPALPSIAFDQPSGAKPSARSSASACSNRSA